MLYWWAKSTPRVKSDSLVGSGDSLSSSVDELPQCLGVATHVCRDRDWAGATFNEQGDRFWSTGLKAGPTSPHTLGSQPTKSTGFNQPIVSVGDKIALVSVGFMIKIGTMSARASTTILPATMPWFSIEQCAAVYMPSQACHRGSGGVHWPPQWYVCPQGTSTS